MDTKVILALVVLSTLAVGQVSAGIAGGFITWQHVAGNKIKIDYTLLISGNEAKSCTPENIASKKVSTFRDRRGRITSIYNKRSWNWKARSYSVGKVEAYCRYPQSLSNKYAVFQSTDNQFFTSPTKKFIILIPLLNGYGAAAFVDLTVRSDTGMVNRPVKLVISPSDRFTEKKTMVSVDYQFVDEDGDYISCRSNKQPCASAPWSSLRVSSHSTMQLFREFPNITSDRPVGMTYVGYQRDYPREKVSGSFKPNFTLFANDQQTKCLYPQHADVQGDWRRQIDIEYDETKFNLSKLEYQGSKDIIIKEDRSQDGRLRIVLSFDAMTTEKRHLACFNVYTYPKTGPQKAFARIMKCLRIYIDHPQMRYNLVTPMPESTIDSESFEKIQFKVNNVKHIFKPKSSKLFLQNLDTKKNYSIHMNMTSNMTIGSHMVTIFNPHNNIDAGRYRIVIEGKPVRDVDTIGCDDEEMITWENEWIFIVKKTQQISNIQSPPSNTKKMTHNHKKYLVCKHDRMMFDIQPAFPDEISILKVTLRDDNCKLTHNKDIHEYSIQANYNTCGTQLIEEEDHIVYKNVARVHYKNKTIEQEMIERTLSFNVGLECRLKRTAIRTIKGKREPEDGMIVGPQSVLISDYARGNGSFSIDFEVFKTGKYLESYGKNEFPINVAVDHRIFFEVSLNQNDGLNLNLIPRECYATRTRSFQDSVRHYIIEDSCPKDDTYKQHRYTKDVFQFSIQAFTFTNGNNGIFVHCESYVCKNTTDHQCRFGCDKEDPMRKMGRRSIDVVETASVDGIMTSTLEISIKDPKIISKKPSLPSTKQEDATKSLISILPYIQIPILASVLVGLYFVWRFCCKQSNKKVENKIYIESKAPLTYSADF
ncbi:uncharacterized protein [Clytia hemisphaerica]|uniref:ZP domain-containing protein n=1 Tax=Clytia hemisphaerica TaxID=252671 RepID=A0A7M5TX84_9CNID